MKLVELFEKAPSAVPSKEEKSKLAKREGEDKDVGKKEKK